MLAFRHLAYAGCAVALAITSIRPADTVPKTEIRLADRARELLRIGQPVAAAKLIDSHLGPATDGTLWRIAGEVQFRLGDFAAAARNFHAALDRNPADARAWWGLGRIEQIHFRQPAARNFFAQAYRLDWQDSDVVLSYLEFVADPAARRRLLANLVTLTRNTSPARAAQAQAEIAIEDRLAGRERFALASDYVPYHIPLRDFHPSCADPRGLIVTAQVNGKRPLRLVLDTGARGILLRESAARNLGLDPVVESQVMGFGANSGSPSMLTLASTVEIGSLVFRDCPIEVSPAPLPDGADGILGISLFKKFRIRIDAGSRLLVLSPDESIDEQPASALGLDRLLLVRTMVAGSREGWFLLDTGAAFTAVAPALHPLPHSGSGPMQLAGLQGSTTAFHTAPLLLHVGGRVLADREPVVLDLAAISQREGVEISGVLGYSTLRRWPVTIDFRSGVVRIGD